MKKVLLGIALLLLLVAGLPAHAQSNGVALGKIIYLKSNGENEPYGETLGDLYSYTPGDAAAVRETTWGYNDIPILSPNGQYVAYLSLPQFMVELLAADDPNALMAGGIKNIWLWNLATGDFTRIADQPADATAFNGIYRSRPAWSPDSTKLAWVEMRVTESAVHSQLMIYNLADGTTQLVVDSISVGFQDAAFVVPNTLAWGESLIWQYFTFGLGEDGSRGGTVIEVINETGLLNRFEIQYLDDPGPPFIRAQWMQREGQWVIGMLFEANTWQILNPATGERAFLKNPPVLQTPTGQGYKLGYDDGSGWYGVAESSFALGTIETTVSAALSPDGNSIAIVHDDGYGVLMTPEGLGFIPDDTGTETAGLLHVVWSPMIWHAEGDASPVDSLPLNSDAPTPAG